MNFRVRDLKNNVFCDEEIFFSNCEYLYRKTENNKLEELSFRDYEINFSTELSDKNKKEIFENDIVQVKPKGPYKFHYLDTFIGVVEYVKKNGAFLVYRTNKNYEKYKGLYKEDFYYLQLTDEYEITILDNVYDNSDVL